MPIVVRDVTYSYSKGTSLENQVLNNLTFKVDEGKFTAILGDTGAGKSTLLRLVVGLLKPDNGTVLIDGFDAGHRSVKGTIGVLFQNPEKQLFSKTCYEDIAFGPLNLGFEKEDVHQKVLTASAIVGFEQKNLETSPFKLSGGEKKKLALAGVLAMEPKYLILDEPTTGLDYCGKKGLLSNLGLIHSKGTTIIMITHQLTELLSLAQDVLYLKDGTIDFHGSVQEFIEFPSSNKPPITHFMSKLNEHGLQVNQNLYTVNEAFSEIKSYVHKRMKDHV
ncbi:energy-coupling factor ABC transporter ATP-binding protein [Methanosalsum natronophilum]|uniref:energy-coupling factor ABC transporter ATP-binding protein n=1 Tax=Methanosalsum natronophilum TaxID=768733 RepID=UPI00216A9F2B|nr:energy-coupling factor ABC transporter ATP-binding protein [Methanosalsum natronophilum]MCS3924256.1 energy-coupling factor transport system ATP-binding protein [Methanosalsum natronophilum]